MVCRRLTNGVVGTLVRCGERTSHKQRARPENNLPIEERNDSEPDIDVELNVHRTEGDATVCPARTS